MRITAAILAAALVLPAQAQFFQRLFNPQVEVTLTHPPGLGLAVRRVVFAPAEDRRSEELISAFVADLTGASGLEVIDRGRLDSILAEQKLGASGLMEEATALRLGRLLGAPVLLSVKVHALRARQVPLSRRVQEEDDHGRERTVVEYISRTEAELAASVQAVDCLTGKVFKAIRLSASPARENMSQEGRPQYPPSREVLDQALREATRDLHRLLLPWTERRQLTFHDDRDYGMKEAYLRLRVEDPRGALRLSREARDRARADAGARRRHRARTAYNLGICHLVLGEYAEALPALREALAEEPDNDIFQEALRACRQATSLLAACREAETLGGPAAAGSLEDRLRRLEELRGRGLITDQDFERRKAELLKEI